MKQLILSLFTVASLAVSCSQSPADGADKTDKSSEIVKEADVKIELSPEIKAYKQLFGVLPKVADNPQNVVSDDKVELGRKLYFDARLSKSGEISCNSCHNLASYGVDNLPTSIGHKWQTGNRNSPTTLNAALHFAQFWDAREPDVEAQAKGPVLNPIEMGSPHESFVVDRLASIPAYVESFKKVFSGGNSLTYENMAKAIGAFERTLITPARFDAYLEGDSTAITLAEKQGLETFKAVGCVSCHSGPLLGGSMLQKFGTFKPFTEFGIADDSGKMSVTKQEADKYLFKVPSLRNITRTYPYFHDGSVWDLKQSIQIMAQTQLNKKLSEGELASIVLFFNTLEGELSDEQLKLPVLPASTSTTSKPDFN